MEEVEDQHVCLLCDISYTQQDDLLKHLATDHNMKFECSTCNKLFISSVELKDHVAYFHDKKPMYECLKCGEKFTKEKDLTAHNFSLHKERKERLKKYNCSYCEEIFSAIKVLKKHMIKTHKKPFTCEICKKSFKIKARYQRHIGNCTDSNLSADEKKKNPNLCSFCGKSYVSKSSLWSHIAIVHEGEAISVRFSIMVYYVCLF